MKMMSNPAAIWSIALFLLFTSTNVKGQCTDTQLPNVLALGTCLGLTPDYCSDRPENATVEIIRIFTCVFRMMPQVTGPIQALFYLRALIAGVLSRAQSDANPFAVANMLCNPFGLPMFSCNNGFPGTITCGPPINISLPTSFGTNNCINTSRLICLEGETLRNDTMIELLDFLGKYNCSSPFTVLQCLLRRSPGDGGTLAGRLACTLAQLVQLSAQQFTAAFPLPLLAAGIQASANRLSTELALRARCF